MVGSIEGVQDQGEGMVQRDGQSDQLGTVAAQVVETQTAHIFSESDIEQQKIKDEEAKIVARYEKALELAGQIKIPGGTIQDNNMRAILAAAIAADLAKI